MTMNELCKLERGSDHELARAVMRYRCARYHKDLPLLISQAIIRLYHACVWDRRAIGLLRSKLSSTGTRTAYCRDDLPTVEEHRSSRPTTLWSLHCSKTGTNSHFILTPCTIRVQAYFSAGGNTKSKLSLQIWPRQSGSLRHERLTTSC